MHFSSARRSAEGADLLVELKHLLLDLFGIFLRIQNGLHRTDRILFTIRALQTGMHSAMTCLHRREEIGRAAEEVRVPAEHREAGFAAVQAAHRLDAPAVGALDGFVRRPKFRVEVPAHLGWRWRWRRRRRRSGLLRLRHVSVATLLPVVRIRVRSLDVQNVEVTELILHRWPIRSN